MALGSRINQRLTEIKKKSSWLSRELGLASNSSVRGLINSDAESSGHASNIAKILGVRLDWLIDGIEPMVDLIPSQKTIAIDYGEDKDDTHNNITRYDIKLSAGKGTAEWIVRPDDDDPLFFRKGWFKARHLNAENLRALTVRGDSMEPYLFNHDTVIINIEDIEMIDGDTYAIVFKDKFYVKELSSADGEARIISKNAKYEAMQTDKNEADQYNNYFQILGCVVWRGG